MAGAAAEPHAEASGLFSVRAFLASLGGFTALSLLIAGWLWVNAEKTRESRQDKLPSQTVVIVREEPEIAPAGDVPEDLAKLPLLPSGLYAAPAEGLYEKSDLGFLPKAAGENLTPFKVYARPVNPGILEGKKAVLAVVISDLGLSGTATESAVRTMPPEVTLAFSPYGQKLDFYAEQARADGHELWLGLPLEPADLLQEDPGPYALLADASLEENKERLKWIMSRVVGYTGVIGAPRSVYFQDEGASSPLLEEIFGRGLAYADASPKPPAGPHNVALAAGAPYASADLWIDEETDAESVRAALDRLVETALHNGHAIGFARPLPVSYREVLKWLDTLPGKGIVLVPLSALAK